MMILLIVLGMGTVLVVGVGDRLRLPWPALMVFLGAAVALIPGLEVIEIDPDLILPLFLPPLLFATAQRTSWTMFRSRWRTILFLAVGLVGATVAVVTATALWLIPGITLSAAIALGAMVAPPDPVAVEAVSGSVSLPRRILQVLQSEGLFNDAAALVVFQFAVAATMEGSRVDFGQLLLSFVVSAVLAVVVGLVLSLGLRVLLRFTQNSVARSMAHLVLPFAVYLVAEHVNASGVIAVVVAALEMRQHDDAEQVEERLMQNATWEVLEMLITGVAFGLIGLELRITLMGTDANIVQAIVGGLVISAVMLVTRFAWLFAGTYLIDPRAQRGRSFADYLKGTVVMTWGGMRGLATLALALSLPYTTDDGSPFPARTSILMVVVAVLATTLLAAGLTFPALVNRLGLTGAKEHAQEARIAARARRASLSALKHAPDVPEEVREELRKRMHQLEGRLAGEDEEGQRTGAIKQLQQYRGAFRQMQALSLKAARAEVLRARSERGVDPAAADQVLHRLDLQTALLDQPTGMLPLVRERPENWPQPGAAGGGAGAAREQD
ncbi:MULTISPECIES: Na+/H+ antiporter [Brevibacterium]|nr:MULTISPECIES: Na+/H+ antiporter [Brevibacterium]WAL41675.1 Na+/H+ antiporter [Brevibacterium sp. BRM-1]